MIDERGWTKPNEKGEYEIGEGTSAVIFKALLVMLHANLIVVWTQLSCWQLPVHCNDRDAYL